MSISHRDTAVRPTGVVPDRTRARSPQAGRATAPVCSDATAAPGPRGIEVPGDPYDPVVWFIDGTVCAAHILLGDRWLGGWQAEPSPDGWRIVSGGHDEEALPEGLEVHATGLVAACAGAPIGAFAGGVAPDVRVGAIAVYQRTAGGMSVPEDALCAALDAVGTIRRPGPVVVVLPLSTWTAPPLGDGPVERAIDRLASGAGVHVVCAAGNHRMAGLHAVALDTTPVRLVSSPGATTLRLFVRAQRPGAAVRVTQTVSSEGGEAVVVLDETTNETSTFELNTLSSTTSVIITCASPVDVWCLDGGRVHPDDADPADTLGVPASAAQALRVGAVHVESGPDGRPIAHALPWSCAGGPVTGRIDTWVQGDAVPVPTRGGVAHARGTSIAAARAAGMLAAALADRPPGAPAFATHELRDHIRAATHGSGAPHDSRTGGLLDAAALCERLRGGAPERHRLASQSTIHRGAPTPRGASATQIAVSPRQGAKR